MSATEPEPGPAVTDEAIAAIADAVMRGVVASGSVTVDNLDTAVRVIRQELQAFIAGDLHYEGVRWAVLDHSINSAYALGSVVAECVERLEYKAAAR